MQLTVTTGCYVVLITLTVDSSNNSESRNTENFLTLLAGSRRTVCHLL
jgi:hypothetical protein